MMIHKEAWVLSAMCYVGGSVCARCQRCGLSVPVC
jgi:hypothetical protein